MIVSLEVEYGAHERSKTTREAILFQRNASLALELVDRYEK